MGLSDFQDEVSIALWDWVISKMASSKVPYVQDMPPRGGYPSIMYHRNLPVRGFNGWIMLGATGVVMALGFWKVRIGNKELR